MEKLMAFATVLSWLFGVGAIVMVMARINAMARYDKLAAMRDRLNGVKRTFPVAKPLCVAAVCVAWIIATW